MSIHPTSAGRVSNLLTSQRALTALRRLQAQANKTQLQLTSGYRINSVSEDPVLAGQILTASSRIGRLGQFQRQTAEADGLLSAADAALGEAIDLVRQAQALAIDSVGVTASDSERAANVALLDSLIGRIQRLANRDFQGRFLFDGQAGGASFSDAGGGILYAGGRQPFRLALAPGWELAAALDGVTVFGAESNSVSAGYELSPIATVESCLSDLRGAAGAGVALGRIRVSDGVNPAVVIDLRSADTLDDVITLFNAAAPTGTALSLDASGLRLRVTAPLGSSLTIQDVDAGTAARDLGILAANAGRVVVGADIEPLLTERTPVALLRRGEGADLSWGVVITNGSLSTTVDLSAAQTVGDILNSINHAGVGARAAISPDGRSIHVFNAISGVPLRITENEGGLTAAHLGLRTFHHDLSLASLRGGRGIDRVAGLDDLRITQRDGTTLDINLDSAAKIGDIIDLIHNHPANAGTLSAALTPFGGIELTDLSPNAGFALSVTALNLSPAAGQLGLLKTVTELGEPLIGDDVSGAYTGGLLDHLVRLRNAMASSDAQEVGRLGGLIEQDLDRLTGLRGAVGAQAAEVISQAELLDATMADQQSLLSGLRDLDLTEAVMEFQRLQSQLTASLMATGKLLNLSLLDFLD